MEVQYSFPGPEWELRWRDFLKRADYPTHYVAPEFFVEPFLTGKKPFALLATCGDRIMGVLTGTHDGSGIRCGVNGRPQIAVDPEAEPGVITALFEALKTEGRNAELITAVSWSTYEQIRSAGFTER
ncbi:MAG TPA: hypothetical protein VF135_03565, partial [Terriglobales bacterium]